MRMTQRITAIKTAKTKVNKNLAKFDVPSLLLRSSLIFAKKALYSSY